VHLLTRKLVVASIGFILGVLFREGWAALLKHQSDRRIEQQKSQHSKELLAAQNVFSVGVTSPMATVAFDKHVEFCEEYVKEMSEALHALIQNGKPEEMLDTRRLSIIREKWALWLTHEIENTLDEVERRIRLVGGPAQVLEPDGTPASNAGALASIIKRSDRVFKRGGPTHGRAHRPQKRTGEVFTDKTTSSCLTLISAVV
jgi:hypothetical protein